MRWLAPALLVLLLAGAASAQGLATERPGVDVRRFALAVGANDGGADRVRLRYAGSDARTIARLLVAVGGVRPVDSQFIEDGDVAALDDAFARLASRIAAAPGRTEVLFYYSGHSDEEGLLIGQERVTWSALRATLDGLGADLQVAVVDSCASGTFTRGKGGSFGPPVPPGGREGPEGHAFVTSASSDELAQESDRIGGSYFTYAWASGLRGAADIDRDRRVTLAEAYRFAYHETLRRTERTVAGPQHPTYEFSLRGRDDLVLTDLRRTSATVRLDDEVEGRVAVRRASGRLEVELHKALGDEVELALEPGAYTATLVADRAVSQAAFVLAEGGCAELYDDDFTEVQRERALARGEIGDRPDALDRRDDPDDLSLGDVKALRAVGYRYVPADLGLFPPLSVNWTGNQREINHFALGILGHEVARLRGWQMSSLFNVASENAIGAQLSAVTNVTARSMRGTQLAWGLNTVGGQLDGVQIAVLNVSGGRMRGAQLGIVNVSRERMWGWQVGAVNIADDGKGVMMGVVNVSRDFDGWMLGLINIARNGIHELDLYGSDAGLANIGIKLGGQRNYTMFVVSASPWSQSHLALGGGVGVRFQLPAVRLDLDVLASWKPTALPETHLHTRARATVGIPVADGVHLLAGLTFNVGIELDPGRGPSPFEGPASWRSARPEQEPLPTFLPVRVGEWGAARLGIWPGFLFGVSL